MGNKKIDLNYLITYFESSENRAKLSVGSCRLATVIRQSENKVTFNFTCVDSEGRAIKSSEFLIWVGYEYRDDTGFYFTINGNLEYEENMFFVIRSKVTDKDNKRKQEEQEEQETHRILDSYIEKL